MAIKFNIKNIFMFSVIYTSVYLFLMSFFGNSTNIINKANFSFLNYGNVLNQCIAVLGGSGSFVFKLFFTVVNFTWLQYIFAYIMSPFFFLADFLLNIVYLIVYEITVIQYPLSSGLRFEIMIIAFSVLLIFYVFYSIFFELFYHILHYSFFNHYRLCLSLKLLQMLSQL